MGSMLRQWHTTTPEQAWVRQDVTQGEYSATATADMLAVTGERHQRILGFGGCFNEIGWEALTALDAGARTAVLRRLFHPTEGLHFTHCRVPVGASDFALEWYSHDEVDGDLAMEHFSLARDQRYLLPYIHAAQQIQPDLTLFASPWSPPTWMKQPRAYNHGTLRWEPAILSAYARYLLRFVHGYAEAGVAVTQLHVQNEPYSDQKFPSCVWTGAQLRDFIRDYLGPLFASEGAATEIWLGTINSPDYDAYANTVLSDAAARRYITGVGYQWAGKAAIARTAASWPELRLMQTEGECGDGANSWDYAHYTFALLQHYLTNGAERYIAWNMVLPPGGMSTWGWQQNALITVDPATQAVTYNPEYFVMQHIAQAIAPGAVRLGLRGHWAGNALAFDNPDGSRIILIQNPLPTARPCYWNDAGGSVHLNLAPHSLHTLVFAAPDATGA